MKENLISPKELYRIINRAVTLCANHQNTPVDTEISLFYQRYEHHCRQNHQLNMFEEEIASKKELYAAREFCELLEVYRQVMDVYTDDAPELSISQSRRLLAGIDHYRPQIYPENLSQLNMLEYNLKLRLPEHREKMKLDEYIRSAAQVYDMKRGYDRQRRKNQPVNKDYEKYALHFFKTLRQDEEINNMSASPEKIALYEAALRIVDCLPVYKYNRTDKFRLKIALNGTIKNNAETLCRVASDLPQIKQYKEMAEKADYEIKRYQNAVDKSLQYAGTSGAKTSLSLAARNKRAKDEWDYK